MKVQKTQKKKILKKIFIKICRILGFEIIDQSSFSIPTKNLFLNENLSSVGKKSITLPMGEIKITRKIKSIHIIFRFCTNINMLTQSKERIFSEKKNQYTFRSLNSILKSVQHAKNDYSNIPFKITLIDSGSTTEDLNKINKILKNFNIENYYISLDKNIFSSLVDNKASKTQQSNMANIQKSFEIARDDNYDLYYFVEDDYLHEIYSISEMLFTYEKISSQAKDEIIICPTDYPYLYNKSDNTKIFLGHRYHWRVVDETLVTFLTSKKIILDYFDLLISMTKQEHLPFEKPLHDIYKEKYCISPVPSVAVHYTNINSIYGLSPFKDWKKLWEENKI